MKKYLLVLSMLVITSSSLFAQDNYPFSLGVSASVGAIGTNTSHTPRGIGNVIDFFDSWNAAAVGYLPMADDSRTGVFIEIGITNAAWGMKLDTFGFKGYINQRLFTVSPILMMSGFTFGIDFGFAEKYTIKEDFSLEYMPYQNDLNASIRIGYMQPLYTTSFGTLNVHGNFTYSVTSPTYYGDYDYTPLTLNIGLNYLISLGYDEGY
ncbi:MAG: hypothetical protein LBO69_00390 [Ignavibacteria bacterium]|jgi:hypothetical protein|nr:hypothetical protein [Ignavibacteria bacterium]